jgi:hypothetical protein
MNGHGRDISMESDRPPFDLVSSSLYPPWTDLVNPDVEGWEKSTVKYATTVSVREGAATTFSPDWTNVDRVQFKANGGHFIAHRISMAFG